ncbi:MAG: S8 family serine peptidase [Bacteroidota bacterium]
MKKIIIIICSLLFTNLNAQDSTYYWYEGQKQYLNIASDQEFVLLKNNISKEELENELNWKGPISIVLRTEIAYQEGPKLNEPSTKNWAIIKKNREERLEIKSLQSILYSAPYYESKKGKRVGISHLFYVRLKSQEDLPILQQIAKETKVEILSQNQFMPLWYKLSCSKNSEGNSLEMSNYFFESGHFEAAEPNFIGSVKMLSPNDEYYGDQWGLDNTGQYGGTSGMDINVSGAWGITQGDENITVAVIDQGIETSHFDLNNLSPYSFDTQNESSPSMLRGWHGMSVSGII